MIIIRHDHTDGTTITGSTNGDGVLELVTPFGFTWRRSAGIHVPGSRDTFSWRRDLAGAADALRAAGHEVTIEVDDTWRPASVRYAERGDRVAARVERLGERADAALARSDAARERARQIADGMPLGEPIKVGHHSEAKHRRAFERIDTGTRRAIEEGEYAAHLASRAEGSAANEAAKHDPRAVMRRIATLRTGVRAADRRLARPTLGDLARSRQQPERDRDLEEITYLEGILAAHAETGTFLAWGPETIAKGDRVLVCGHWYPVTRVNRLSVSLGGDGWPSTAKWDAIHGRRRDGMQLDTPNGEPWPETDAIKVAMWEDLDRRGRAAANRYGVHEARVSRIHRLTLRIVLGLPTDAGDPEVRACLPDQDDVPTARAFAILCLAVHKRLTADEPPADVAASTEPFPTTPAWRVPTDREPEDVRVDRLAAGDLVAGLWDRDSMARGGRVLRRNVAGPVLAVSDVRDRRESGRWVTVTLDDGEQGEQHEFQTHRWAAAYLAGTWERPAVG